ncbi:MAG: class I SAM-dependent RNA methyltransferase [Alphaproteobacteria bacterium]|nr:class I SAM-dependent RNA methyltransferase [Alphaproteobacteria bacterium]
MMPHLDIEWILPDGRVGGRAPDGTFKVAGALPGATIEATHWSKRGSAIEIDTWRETAPSPHRVPHPCPVLERCGGCDLGALDAEVRRQHLLTMVRRALQLAADPAFVASPRRVRHRARVRLAVDGASLGFRAHRSHALVDLDDCHAAREEVAARIAEVRARLPIEGLEAVEVRSDGSRAVLALEGRVKTADLEGLDDVALNGRAVHGDPTLVLDVLGIPLRCSPKSFYQVNPEVNAALVRHVRDAVVEARPERVVDLYAGIGNLTLPIAATGAPTVAVELEGQATADLRHNAASNGLAIEVHTGKVEKHDLTRTPFDVAVLDPPRAGAGPVMERVLRQRPRRIVLVSCHVPSAARDVRPALKAGYRLVDATCFEMFVDTHHLETVTVLDR